jgi:SNF2 family DNA or RNA helicase
MDKKGDAVEKWNNGEIKMLVGHPASMGHGLNLHKSNAHLIVWFGFNYSLELYEQFNARLRRQGQKFPVALIHLAVGRVEYKLMRALADKKLTQDSIMNALKG